MDEDVHDERTDRYRRSDIEGLVNGHWLTDDGVPIRVDDTWARIRSRIESAGDVETDAWIAVLDLERALRMLSAPIVNDRRELSVLKDARAAAMLISTKLLLGYDRQEMRDLYKGNAERLIRKGCAWIAHYLNGEDFEACDRAFRRAK